MEVLGSKRYTAQELVASSATTWEGSQGPPPARAQWEPTDANCLLWDPGGAHYVKGQCQLSGGSVPGRVCSDSFPCWQSVRLSVCPSFLPWSLDGQKRQRLDCPGRCCTPAAWGGVVWAWLRACSPMTGAVLAASRRGVCSEIHMSYSFSL